VIGHYPEIKGKFSAYDQSFPPSHHYTSTLHIYSPLVGRERIHEVVVGIIGFLQAVAQALACRQGKVTRNVVVEGRGAENGGGLCAGLGGVRGVVCGTEGPADS